MKYIPGKLSQMVSATCYTYGGQFMNVDGQEYVGPYFVINDKIYPGTPDKFTITQQLKSLIPLNRDPNYIRYINIINRIPYLKNQAPKATRPFPLEKDYEKGWIYRYFCRKRNDNLTDIIEIDEEQFKNIAVDKPAINPTLYKVIRIKWLIKGNRNNIMHNGRIKILSVQNANLAALREANKEFPGIINKLLDLAEFAHITE